MYPGKMTGYFFLQCKMARMGIRGQVAILPENPTKLGVGVEETVNVISKIIILLACDILIYNYIDSQKTFTENSQSN